MAIAGFGFKKILAERYESSKGNIKVDAKLNIKEIKEEDLKLTDKEALKITFSFLIDYSPKFAEILFEGEVLFVEDSKKIKKILDLWKDKKIEEEMRLIVFNFLITKCSIKALAIEEELGLPFHLPLPRMKSEKK
jgi:hypothetical protein